MLCQGSVGHPGRMVYLIKVPLTGDFGFRWDYGCGHGHDVVYSCVGWCGITHSMLVSATHGKTPPRDMALYSEREECEITRRPDRPMLYPYAAG